MGLGTKVDREIGALDLASLTTDLKPWQVEREVLLLTDNSYVLGFACTPPATEAMSSAELEELARRGDAWLRAVPEGEDVRLVYTVEPNRASTIQDHAARTASVEGPLAELRDERLRVLRHATAEGTILEPRLTVLLSYHPVRLRPSNRWSLSAIAGGLIGILVSAWTHSAMAGAAVAVALFGGLAFVLPRAPGRMAPRLEREFEEDHRVLRGLRDVMLAHLKALRLAPRPLRSEEYLEVAWRYMNPRKSAGGVEPPPLPGPLYELAKHDAQAAPWALPVSMRQLIAGSDLDRDYAFLRKDDRCLRVLAMDALPVGTTVMNHLIRMLALREPLTAVLDIHKPRTASMISALLARSTLLGGVSESAVSEGATISASVTHESLQRVLIDVFRGRTQVVSVGLGIVIARATPEALVRTSLRLHQEAGTAHALTLIDETVALSPQYRRLMPGSGQTNRRMRMVQAMNAVHLLPISGPWRGSPRAEVVLHNRWGGVTAFDIFDPRAPAWNGVVFGRSGSGKSALMNQILAQHLRHDVSAIVIDKGVNTPPNSFLTLTRALGGSEIIFSMARGTSLNPFDVEPEQLRYFQGETVAPDVADHAAAKQSFLTTLIDALVSPREGPHLSLDEKNLVGEAIVQTYQRAAVRREPVFLHDLVAVLRNPGGVGGHQPTTEQKETMERIGTRLWQWIERGRYAQLLDRPTTVRLEGPITYIDIGPVTEQPDLLPIAILLLNDLVYRQALSQASAGRRTIVVQDESWSILSNPVAAEFLSDMYRRFRQVDCAVFSMSQDAKDFEHEGVRAILGNATWWIILDATNIDTTREVAKLNDREVALAQSLGGRAGEYSEALVVARLSDHRESGVVQAIPTSLEFWLSASHLHERQLRATYIAQAGDVWGGLRQLARDHPRGADLLLAKEALP